MYESNEQAWYAACGDVHSIAFNPIRDTLFGGNQTAYDIWGITSGIAISMMMPIIEQYPKVGHLSNELSSSSAASSVANIADDYTVTSNISERNIKTIEINNPVLDNIRSGSALKEDSLHAFNDIIDNYAGDATEFSLVGGDGVESSLYQIEGSLNGKQGIFEWIVDPDSTKGVTHRRFIPDVGITGKPNARP